MGRKKHGSLFSGIGGFDLAASWMGWENVFQVELSAFCNTVLAHHFPATKRYRDIRQFKAEEYHGTIDVISGGFPCQPFSTAGQRRGSEDNRFLWPEALRVITNIRPRWIVLENVAGLFSILEPASLSRMEIEEVELFCQDKNRKASKTVLRVQRRVIGTILEEIRAAGYILPTLTDGTPVIVCVPACGVGAPHRRDRIWIVAHANSDAPHGIIDPLGGTVRRGGTTPQEPYPNCGNRPAHTGSTHEPARPQQGGGQLPGKDSTSAGPPRHDLPTGNRAVPDADSDRREGVSLPQGADTQGRQIEGGRTAPHTGDYWSTWPTQSPVCSRNDGFPGRLDSITFSKWRNESLHAFGNAIVPEVAYQLFLAIAGADRQQL